MSHDAICQTLAKADIRKPPKGYRQIIADRSLALRGNDAQVRSKLKFASTQTRYSGSVLDNKPKNKWIKIHPVNKYNLQAVSIRPTPILFATVI